MALSKLMNWRKPKQLDLEQYLAKLASKGLNPDGSPKLDPTPMAPPIGYKKHPSMVEIVRDMVRSERLAQEARQAGAESFEDAEDFDVSDDPELLRSPYENLHDPSLRDLIDAGASAKNAREKSGLPLESPPAGPQEVKDPPSDGPGLSKPPAE